jgi:Domain of unknown function (DUF1835)
MPRMLHVTNGDATGDKLARQYPIDDLVVWRDVLSEGPIPAGISNAELREVRAAFLASRGWALEQDALEQFTARDAALARFGDYDEVVLWFEHDLYDQLQLIQILDRLPGQTEGEPAISLICIDAYPGVEPFHGLGQLSEEQLGSLFPSRKPVTDEQLILARNAWAAVREPNPSAIEYLLDGDTEALPFLAVALRRFLEQYPALTNGLSRTERQILDAVADGAKTPPELFADDQRQEERPFLGDHTFFDHLQRLGNGPAPLLEQEDGHPLVLLNSNDDWPAFRVQQLVLNERGRRVAEGEEDWAGGPIDHWIGGVFLQADHPGWRWDSASQRLRFPD